MGYDSKYPAKVRYQYRRRVNVKPRTTQWYRHKLGLIAIKMVTYSDEMLKQDSGAAPVLSPRLREALRQLFYLVQEPSS